MEVREGGMVRAPVAGWECGTTLMRFVFATRSVTGHEYLKSPQNHPLRGTSCEKNGIKSDNCEIPIQGGTYCLLEMALSIRS